MRLHSIKSRQVMFTGRSEQGTNTESDCCFTDEMFEGKDQELLAIGVIPKQSKVQTADKSELKKTTRKKENKKPRQQEQLEDDDKQLMEIMETDIGH